MSKGIQPRSEVTGSRLRAVAVLAGFAALTLPLMPVQALLKRTAPRAARRFPHWYHRQVCRILGIRLHIHGQVEQSRPVLLIANHTSWLDIPVLSATAPLSFVAKKEVAGWPFIGTLARLQNTVFVDRERRSSVSSTAGAISERLKSGNAVVLFPEGTSTDGNRVLPFRSSLFAAVIKKDRNLDATGGVHASGTLAGAESAAASSGESPLDPVVQTVALVYTRVQGIPFGRADRTLTGWYGDMEIGPHAWELLKAGPIDVVVEVGEPVPLADFSDRKHLARATEADVRSRVIRIVRTGEPGAPTSGLKR